MRRTVATGCVAVLLAGCGSDPPTWSHDVAPIVIEHCSTCHHSGGLMFPLETYADVKARAPSIQRVVTTGEMPPWPPDSTDGCPSLVGDRTLSPHDVGVITDWINRGMLPGDPKEPIPSPPATFGQLDGISVELGPDQPYTPDPSSDDYHCFLVDPKLTTDAFITAYRVAAGPAVHHLQLWEIGDDAAAAKLQAVDDASAAPGFPCDESTGGPNRYLTVWGPSDPVRRHPAGTGVRVHAGKKLFMQIHYHHATEPDQTSVGLQLADHVDEEARLLALGVSPFTLPARTPATTVTNSMVLGHDAKLWGVRGHMHYLGTQIHVGKTDATGVQQPVDGTSNDQCLLGIPKWDPNWQLMYFYDKPIPLAATDSLDVACTYDTTSQNEDVHDGLTASDEMCFAYFYVTGMPPE